MKKTLRVLILLMILPIISYATEISLSEQRPPSYPHDARMIGKLELTRPNWEGLSKEGYTYELHLEDPFLPHGFPEPKDGLIIEPNVQVVIHVRSPETLREKANGFIGKKVVVSGSLNCRLSCYMEVERIELAE